MECLDTDGFDFPLKCVEKAVLVHGDGVCQSAPAGFLVWRQRCPLSIHSQRWGKLPLLPPPRLSALFLWMPARNAQHSHSLWPSPALMQLSNHTAHRAMALWDRGTGGCQELGCIFFGVTSFLLMFLLLLLGRTGLLADLLPSFAVEIMPGIQSFNSLFAVIPSVCFRTSH